MLRIKRQNYLEELQVSYTEVMLNIKRVNNEERRNNFNGKDQAPKWMAYWKKYQD